MMKARKINDEQGTAKIAAPRIRYPAMRILSAHDRGQRIRFQGAGGEQRGSAAPQVERSRDDRNRRGAIPPVPSRNFFGVSLSAEQRGFQDRVWGVQQPFLLRHLQ